MSKIPRMVFTAFGNGRFIAQQTFRTTEADKVEAALEILRTREQEGDDTGLGSTDDQGTDTGDGGGGTETG